MNKKASATGFLSLLISSVLLCGCASSYVQPSPAYPAAQLTVRTVDLSSRPLGSPNNNFFYAYSDENCTESEGTGKLAFFSRSGGNEENVKVWPDKRIYIKAVFAGYYSKGVVDSVPLGHHAFEVTTAVGIDYCTNVVSFVPEKGHHYLVSQTPQTSSCHVSLLDTGTGNPPATFIVHAVNPGCRVRK